MVVWELSVNSLSVLVDKYNVGAPKTSNIFCYNYFFNIGFLAKTSTDDYCSSIYAIAIDVALDNTLFFDKNNYLCFCIKHIQFSLPFLNPNVISYDVDKTKKQIEKTGS